MGNTSIQTQSYRAVDKDAGQSRSYIIPFALLCSLFFLWAVANNLNDILLPQFQQAFTLTNFQAGLIQSAFYFGYFIIPIPAGILMKKLSYKAGIITGLFLYALGAALFWPAAEIMNYTLFLVGLFVIAAGLGCLETAANPFVTVLGPESSGHFRLNLAQTFNSFGAIIAVVFGQSLILSNVPHQSQDVLDKMSPEQLSAYKHSLVLSVQTPYGFAPIFPDICYHLTHYKPAAADIPVASDNPAHYADAIRYNARTPLQGSLLPLTRLVWA